MWFFKPLAVALLGLPVLLLGLVLVPLGLRFRRRNIVECSISGKPDKMDSDRR